MKVGDRVEMLRRAGLLRRAGFRGLVINSWVNMDNGEPRFSVLWQTGVCSTMREVEIKPAPDTWRLPVKLKRALQERIDRTEEGMRRAKARLRVLRRVKP